LNFKKYSTDKMENSILGTNNENIFFGGYMF